VTNPWIAHYMVRAARCTTAQPRGPDWFPPLGSIATRLRNHPKVMLRWSHWPEVVGARQKQALRELLGR